MADIASLGIAVDSSPVVRATSDLNSLTAAAGKAEASTKELGKASERVSTGTQVLAQRVQAAVTQHNRLVGANDNAARSSMRNVDALRQLSFQINDAATMALSGASAFQILATQGGQVFQTMQTAEGGVRGFLREMASMITPTRLLGAATVAAAGVAVYAVSRWAESQRELARAMYGTGLAAGVTERQLNSMAETAGRAARVSTAAARDTLAALARRGDIDPNITNSSVGPALSRGLQVTLAIDAAEANDLLGTSLSRPVEGYKKLTTALGGYNVVIEESIKKLVDQGRLYEAQQLVLAQIPGRLAPAERVTSAWAQAWGVMTREISNAMDRLGQFTGGPLGAAVRLYERYAEARDRVSQRTTELGGGAGANVQAMNEEQARGRIEALEARLRREEENLQRARAASGGDAYARTNREADIGAIEVRVAKVRGDLAEARARLQQTVAAAPAATDRVSAAFADAAGASGANSMADALERAGRAAAERRQNEEAASRAVAAGVEAERNAAAPSAERLRSVSQMVDQYNAALTALQQFDRQPAAVRSSEQAIAVRDRLRSTFDSLGASLEGQFTNGLNGLVDSTGRVVAGTDQIVARLKTTVDLARERGAVEAQSIRAQGQGQAAEEAALRRQVQLRQQNDPRAGSPAERRIEEENEVARLRLQNAQNLIVAQQERARSVMLSTEADRAQMAVQNGSIEQQERVRVSMHLINDARREYIRLTGNANAQVPEAEAAAYRKLAEEMARVRQIAAEKRALDEAAFSRQTMFLSDSERGIATSLRSLYGDQYQSQMNGAIAAQIRFNEQLRMTSDLAQDFGRTFVTDILNGKSATEALGNAFKNLAGQLIQMAMNQLIRSLFSSLLGALGGGGGGGVMSMFGLYANGAAFAGGNVIPFARGGAFTNSIVSRPTVFPMANGAGLMGEAGPEAVMPLKRDGKGRLGVTVAGGGAAAPVVNYAPSLSIVVEGAANDDLIETVKTMVAKEREDMRREIPSLVTQARRDRTLRSA